MPAPKIPLVLLVYYYRTAKVSCRHIHVHIHTHHISTYFISCHMYTFALHWVLCGFALNQNNGNTRSIIEMGNYLQNVVLHIHTQLLMRKTTGITGKQKVYTSHMHSFCLHFSLFLSDTHTHTVTEVRINVKSIANQASLIDSYSSDALSAQSHKHSAPK